MFKCRKTDSKSESFGPRLLFGTFNAETYWRLPGFAQLPQIIDKQAEKIISQMDHLLAFMCNHHLDCVFTRYPIDLVYLDYLNKLDLKFINFAMNSESYTDISHVTKLWIEQGEKPGPEMTGRELFPYAVDAWTSSFAESLNIHYNGPDYNCVRHVNSKCFSTEINHDVFDSRYAVIVNDTDELASRASWFLQKGPLIIKDPYGAGGTGNLKIDNQGMLNRIISHLKKQEEKGLTVKFILEPFFPKKRDFSCQGWIDIEGNFHLESVHIMKNRGFLFNSMYYAENSYSEMLNDLGYFDSISKIVKELFEAGYFGPVCIDSMELENGSILPLVEINARLSMGFIANAIRRLPVFESFNPVLYTWRIQGKKRITVEELLECLDDNKLLVNQSNIQGILPLAPGAACLNSSTEPGKTWRSKMYVAITAKSDEKRTSIEKRAAEVLSNLGISIDSQTSLFNEQ